MTKEMIGFGHFILFFLFTLSQLTFKCVIGFELGLEEFLRLMEMVEREHCFQCSIK